MVAAKAVDAALRGIGEDAVVHGRGADFFGDGQRGIEWRAGGFVADEFDAEKQTEAADFADVRMRGEWGERGAKMLGRGRNAREEMVRFDVVEYGVTRSGRDGMSLIREAVFECAGALREGFDDSRRNQDGAERRVAAGDSFADKDQIRLDAPMLNGERFAGAAEAGHDFVGDEKVAARAADFGDARGVAVGRSSGAESRANDGFEDKSGGGRGVVGGEKCFEIAGAGEAASRKRFVEGTVEAEAGSDVAPLGNKRLIRRATSDIAADVHRAERAAMIALTAGNDAITIGLADFEKILAGELDGGFGGFRAAGSEIDAAAVTKIGRRESEKACGESFGGSGMKLRSVREGKLRGLRRHRAANFRHAVTDIDDGGLTGGIQKLAAILSEKPATFTAHGDGEILPKISRK